jgi:phosphoglycolate phosphatase-like HAD superfamily hydrolase
MAAATAAGMVAVAVTAGAVVSAADLAAAGARVVVGELRELLPLP